ncbi:MAG: hypothetical protein JXR76_27620 [Deltaproteobacteria bacterium]|nr:hypothetical protein [Deltaproteobacteria bacterium]
MSSLVFSLINLIQLKTGRRLYALNKCLDAARANATDAVGLTSLIEEAIAHDTKTVDMELAWARSKEVSSARGQAVQIDNQIDGLLGAIQSSLKSTVAVLPGNDPVAVAAQKLIAQLFPEGVRAIITLSFEDQLVVNDAIIQRLTGELAGEAGTTGILPFVNRLETLNAQFRTELENSDKKEIHYNTIAAANDKGNLYLRRITAVILGAWNADTPEDTQKRQTLLAPILDQCDRVRLARKGRRAALDVDPDTGKELGDEPAAA